MSYKECIVSVSDDGYKTWHLNGKLHREGGPAIEWANGAKYWYLDGKRHRVDGPAIEFANGTKEWYLDDKKYTEEQFNTKEGKSMFNKLIDTVQDGVVEGAKQAATNEASEILADLGKKLLGNHPFLNTPQGKELSKVVVALLIAEVAPKTGIDINLHPLAKLQVQTCVMNLLSEHMGIITDAVKRLANLQK